MEVTLLLVGVGNQKASFGTGSTQYLWQGYLLLEVYLISDFEKPWRSR
jgi:hypothetical protein